MTLGNAWQGVDFATHRSDGHRISYLAGAMFRRGLFVGDCKGKGWVEDVHMNPHYARRLPEKLPRLYGQDKRSDVDFHHMIQFQREKLEGIVFRDCRDEQVCGTFLYAAYDGMAFRGKSHAQVLMHGSDACSRATAFEMRRGSEVGFALTQLVTLGEWAVATVVTTPGNRGDVQFLNSQMWAAGPATAVLAGRGTVRMEQFNTLSGPVSAHAGRLKAVNGVFDRDLTTHVTIAPSAEAEIVGTVFERGPLRVAGGGNVRQVANSASGQPAALPSSDAPDTFATSFEPDDPATPENKLARHGGIRNVSGARCGAMERDDAHSGKRALLLRGVSGDPSSSFVYQTVAESPVFVLPDTVLTYWIQPLNANGRFTALDLVFSDGRILRESGVRDKEGRGTHPGAPKGAVGTWTKVDVPLRKFTGTRVEAVMAAYDTRKGGGLFETLFDDLKIAPELSPSAWRVHAEPRGGRVPMKTAVRIVHDGSVRVRYTLDGSNPGTDSPLAEGPVALPKQRLTELRYSPLKPDGGVSRQVFAALYETE